MIETYRGHDYANTWKFSLLTVSEETFWQLTSHRQDGMLTDMGMMD